MIRLATEDDWNRIQSWRLMHFENIRKRCDKPRPITGQRGPADAVWLVMTDRKDRAIAALSYTEDTAAKVRYGHDMYAAPNHPVAGLTLGRYFEKFCDDTGYEIRGNTDPENIDYLRMQLSRGYEITSIEIARRPKSVVESGEKAKAEQSRRESEEDRGAFFLRKEA